MSYDVKTEGDAAVAAAMQDAAMTQAADGEDAQRLIAMDEARCTVLRATMNVVKSSLEQFNKMETDTEVAQQDKESLVRAATEFYATLATQLRRFERPLILRPSRRVRVIR